MRRPRFQVLQFPKSRLVTIDVGSMTARRHLMFSMLEVDVTAARREVRRLKGEGVTVSFTSWMIKAIGNAVERNKLVHAMRLGRRKLVVFDEVDVGLPVERTVEGQGAPLALRIASVNTKSIQEIEEELRAALDQSIEDEHDYVLNENRVPPLVMKIFYLAPKWLRIVMIKSLFANPFRAKANRGTVAMTTVNAIGRVSGWILPTRTMHNLLFAFGSVNKKPWVAGDEIAVRDILHLTVAFDHDVIDGVPARNFIADFVRHVEKGSLG